MRVLLISSDTERVGMVTTPLGLGLVAAATRTAGHQVAFFDLLNEPDPGAAARRAITAERPDVVGISVRNIDDQTRENPRFLLGQVKPVVDSCRVWTRAPVVLDGAGYSIFPDAALAYLGADLGMSGDGEAVFPALLERLQAGGPLRPARRARRREAARGGAVVRGRPRLVPALDGFGPAAASGVDSAAPNRAHHELAHSSSSGQ